MLNAKLCPSVCLSVCLSVHAISSACSLTPELKALILPTVMLRWRSKAIRTSACSVQNKDYHSSPLRSLPIAVQFASMMRHNATEVAVLLKLTSGQNQNCRQYLILCEIEFQFRYNLSLSRLGFETKQDIWTLKQIQRASMIAAKSFPSLMKFGPRTPENRPGKEPPTLKIGRRKSLTRINHCACCTMGEVPAAPDQLPNFYHAVWTFRNHKFRVRLKCNDDD